MMITVRKRHALHLVALALGVGLIGIVWTQVIPIWTGQDEVAHFSYIQYIAEEKQLPQFTGEYTNTYIVSKTEEVEESTRVTGTDEVLWQLVLLKRSTHQEFPDTLLDSQISIAHIQSAEREFTRDDFVNAAVAYNPPLYHAMLSSVYSLFYSESVLSRMFLLRFVSVLFAIGTALMSYLLARSIFKRYDFALALGVIVGFLPHVSYISASVNPTGLFIFISTVFTYIAVRILQSGWTLMRSLGLGLSVALAILTRVEGALLIPAALVLVIITLIQKQNRWWQAYHFVLSQILVLALAAWWPIRNAYLYGSLMGKIPDDSITTITGGAQSFAHVVGDILIRWNTLFETLWFRFWCCKEVGDTFSLPSLLFGVITLLAIYGLICWIRSSVRSRKFGEKHTVMLYFTILLIITEILFLAINLPDNGRYVLFLIGPIMILLMWGVTRLIAKSWYHIIYTMVATLMVLYNIAFLIGRAIPTYYL
ncbi:ArnT family glycosyltransferase [Patescibacteria group bacterium]